MGSVVSFSRRSQPLAAHAEPSDRELVLGALAGELAARESLFRRHYPKVLQRLYRLLGRQDDARDLAQEVCLEAFRSLDTLRDVNAFEGWIGRIAVFRARSLIRKHALMRGLGFRSASPIDPERVVSSSAPPDVVAELRCVYRHMDTLPVDVRTAVILRRVEGLSIPEIAEQMGRSPATVKRRLQDARAMFERWGIAWTGEDAP